MIRRVPQSILGVSEPNPSWFGNPPNQPTKEGWTNPNWLKSRFHFSFAEYSNPANTNFGVLRVMNDDLVQPDRGFGAHPHRDMEICTYVVSGELTHQDSTGTKETITRGSIQFMTAGTGVTHSEHNLNKSRDLRFVQMWISPTARGLRPNYGSDAGSFEARHNTWAHLVSGVRSSSSTAIKINQDANIFVTELDAGSNVSLPLRAGRQAYLLCLEGSISIGIENGAETADTGLSQHDAAELYGAEGAVLRTTAVGGSGAHVLVVEMEKSGRGRSDL